MDTKDKKIRQIQWLIWECYGGTCFGVVLWKHSCVDRQDEIKSFVNEENSWLVEFHPLVGRFGSN